MNQNLPLVTLITPAFNEAALLEDNMQHLCDYMRGLEDRYRWEVLLINDGSYDTTGEIAEKLSQKNENIRVIHHGVNMGLGKAFMTGFRFCRGDYVITLDIDLSYQPDHIERLLDKLRNSHADIVLASPYMKGGSIRNVPIMRKFLSVWANRFLSLLSQGRLSTLTCMVRAYRGGFIRALKIRATGMDVMPEIIYKSMVMRGRIEQVPAVLDWGKQLKLGGRRQSSIRIFRQIFTTLLSGFVFRPFMFFVLPGLILLGFAVWVNFWMIVHFFEAFSALDTPHSDPVSVAIAIAYQSYPHTFVVGLLSLMLAIQLIGLGVLALQSKQYFEELFYANSITHNHNESENK